MNQTTGIFLVKEGKAEQAFELKQFTLNEPNSEEVLIQVSHFGLNYADVMSRLGLYKDRPPMPCILGYEVVGLIKKIGGNVKGLNVGDKVLAFTRFGGYADHAIADSRAVIKLENDVDEAEATTLATQYCTAWMAACHMVNLKKGDRVLVHAAAGGVGTALVQIAKWKGCVVYATVGSQAKFEHLRKSGADFCFDYRNRDFSADISKQLSGEKLDVVFDPVGGAVFKKSMNLLGSGGRIVCFGASSWSDTRGGFFDQIKLLFAFGFLHPIFLMMKSKSVIGLNMLRIAESKPEYLQDTMREVLDHYKKGILKPEIDRVFGVDQIADAHEKLAGRNSIGKLVVKW